MSVSTSDAIHCDRCGSAHFRRFGFRILSLRRSQQYQCKDCGKVFCVGEGEAISPPAQGAPADAEELKS